MLPFIFSHVDNDVNQQVEEVKILQTPRARQDEIDYMNKIIGTQKRKLKSLDTKQTEELVRKRAAAREIAKNNIIMDDELWGKSEADDLKEAVLEAKRKELKRWRALNSLPFGSNFNIKPFELMIPKESFEKYEQHSEEELEMMGAEQIRENRKQGFYC